MLPVAGDRRTLLLSHSLSCFSDRLWDFAFPLLLALSHPQQALFLAALYSLCGQVATFCLAARVGVELDAWSRAGNSLAAVRTAVLLQNSATVLLSLTLIVVDDSALLYALVAVMSSVSSLASLAERVTLTQDWAPTMVAGCVEAERLTFNARVRRVYLITKISSPVVAGLVIEGLSVSLALAFVCLWNVVSCFLELRLLGGIWQANGALRRPRVRTSPASGGQAADSTAKAVRAYMRSPMLLCSLSYCLLYCTVLCPGSLLHVHLTSRYDASPAFLALFQATSSSLGVMGTFCVTRAAAAGWEVRASARAFLLLQVTLLWLACSCLWVLRSPSAFLVLLSASRIGLWAFDVAHMQLMQDGLSSASSPGAINAIQSGLCDMFSMLIAVPALVQSEVDFPAMMALSLAAVTASFFSYSFWFARARWK